MHDIYGIIISLTTRASNPHYTLPLHPYLHSRLSWYYAMWDTIMNTPALHLYTPLHPSLHHTYIPPYTSTFLPTPLPTSLHISLPTPSLHPPYTLPTPYCITYIASLSQSVNHTLYNLRQIRSFIDQSTTHLVATSLILPQLDYCNSSF